MERKVRSDKKCRVNPSLDKVTHDKLVMLALSCDRMTKTKLAEVIIKMALNDTEMVIKLQNNYSPQENPYRIIPVRLHGETVYQTKFEES